MPGRMLHALSLALLAWLLCAGFADAHLIVSPDSSRTGATVRYALSVPSEKPLAVVRIEVQFPRQLQVTQVEPLPGWTLTPQGDGSGRMLGAVWDGGRVPSGHFVDVAVLATNPPSATELSWQAIQTYEDGSEVQWTGSEQAQFPAAVTHVVAPDSLAATPLAAAALAVSVAALVVAAASLWQLRSHRGSR